PLLNFIIGDSESRGFGSFSTRSTSLAPFPINPPSQTRSEEVNDEKFRALKLILNHPKCMSMTHLDPLLFDAAVRHGNYNALLLLVQRDPHLTQLVPLAISSLTNETSTPSVSEEIYTTLLEMNSNIML